MDPPCEAAGYEGCDAGKDPDINLDHRFVRCSARQPDVPAVNRHGDAHDEESETGDASEPEHRPSQSRKKFRDGDEQNDSSQPPNDPPEGSPFAFFQSGKVTHPAGTDPN